MPAGRGRTTRSSISAASEDGLKTPSRGKKVKQEDAESDEITQTGIADTGIEAGSEVGDDDGITEYERQRLANIERNKNKLAELGIMSMSMTMSAKAASAAPTPKKAPIKRKAEGEALPRRASLRVKGFAPDGSEALRVRKQEEEQMQKDIEERLRVNGTLSLPEYFSDELKDDKDNQQRIAQVLNVEAKALPASKFAESDGRSKLMKSLTELTVPAWGTGKLVKDRIFSVAMHPRSDRFVGVAGDKWGKIGVWDCGSVGRNVQEEGPDQLPRAIFAAFKRPVSQLSFGRLDNRKLYASSYDGSIRCVDVGSEAIHDTWVLSEEDDARVQGFKELSSGVMWACDHHGQVHRIDPRESHGDSKPKKSIFTLHEKKISSIDFHCDDYTMVTCSLDQTVALWDCRKLKKTGSQNLASRSFGRAMQSAFFSPKCDRMVAQNADDSLYLFNFQGTPSSLKDFKTIRHDNRTGRWVTNFKTVWDPKRNNMFMVGSMSNPRGFDTFDADSATHLTKLTHPLVTAIPALVAPHPTLNAIFTGNASGRVVLFRQAKY